MKMEFKLLISGGDSLKKKFEETLKANPMLHMDLIRAFGHSVMMALRLNEEDKISIDGFRAGEIPDLGPVTKEEVDAWKKDLESKFSCGTEENSNKKVDN